MILSVPESKGEIFDKILDIVRQSGISDVTEIEVSNESVIQVGELIIDSLQHTIQKGKQEISVTNIEFPMLYFLALHKGMAMSKSKFMNMYGMENMFLTIATLHHIFVDYE